jgi:hypothetical protein
MVRSLVATLRRWILMQARSFVMRSIAFRAKFGNRRSVLRQGSRWNWPSTRLTMASGLHRNAKL